MEKWNNAKLNDNLVNLCRQSRLKYETNILQSTTKKFYSYVKQQMSSIHGVLSAPINNQAHETTDAKELADIFVDQFANAFKKELTGNLPVLDMRQLVNASNRRLEHSEDI